MAAAKPTRRVYRVISRHLYTCLVVDRNDGRLAATEPGEVNFRRCFIMDTYPLARSAFATPEEAIAAEKASLAIAIERVERQLAGLRHNQAAVEALQPSDIQPDARPIPRPEAA